MIAVKKGFVLLKNTTLGFECDSVLNLVVSREGEFVHVLFPQFVYKLHSI